MGYKGSNYEMPMGSTMWLQFGRFDFSFKCGPCGPYFEEWPNRRMGAPFVQLDEGRENGQLFVHCLINDRRVHEDPRKGYKGL